MKIYDLTLPLSVKTTQVFPGTPPMEYRLSHTVVKDNYNLGIASINSHAGTHTDAPRHFLDSGCCLDQVDIEKYIGYTVIVDCTHRGAFEEISVEDVRPYEEQIRKHKKVILKTGWSGCFREARFFTDYPVITEKLAEYLVELGVHMIGVEAPSLNPDKAMEVHKIFLKCGVAVVEALTNLERLPREVMFFSGAPVGIAEADGFPIRAAVIDFEE